MESSLNWISFSGFKRSPYLYFWLKTFPRLIFPFPGLYFLAAMIAPFILPQSQRDDHCMHIFTPNPTHQFKSSSVPNTKYQPHFPFSSYYTVLAIQNYVSFSLITSLNLVFVFVFVTPRTFNFENILWTVLFSGKQPAQKWTSSNLNQILTKGSFNKSRASPLI